MINHYPEIESEINKIANIIQSIIIEKLSSDYQLVLAVLFKRIINGYNSINLLITNGFYLEALIVMRSAVEARIVMTSLIKEPDKTLEKLRLLTEKNIRQFVENARDLVADYNEINIEHLYGKNDIGIRTIALFDYNNNQLAYEFEYSELCSIVHINKRSLEMMLVKINDKITLAENILINGVQPFYDRYVTEITMTFIQMYQQFKIEMDEPMYKLIDLSKKLLNINL